MTRSYNSSPMLLDAVAVSMSCPRRCTPDLICNGGNRIDFLAGLGLGRMADGLSGCSPRMRASSSYDHY